MSEQSTSSRGVKYILINATILLVADLILIIVNLFVDLPRLTLVAPLWLTATGLFLSFFAFLLLRK